jgi:hypothetical protein
VSDDVAMIRPEEQQAAFDVLLLMADADARWWDYGNAVRLLDHAEEAAGELPLEYQLKRDRWARLRDMRNRQPQAWSRQAA